MMNILKRSGAISVVGISAYLAGKFSERKKYLCDDALNFSLLEKFPALPLVGTVSAAVPVPEEKFIDESPKLGESNVAIRSAQVRYMNEVKS